MIKGATKDILNSMESTSKQNDDSLCKMVNDEIKEIKWSIEINRLYTEKKFDHVEGEFTSKLKQNWPVTPKLKPHIVDI